jgi:hypothetical protein
MDGTARGIRMKRRKQIMKEKDNHIDCSYGKFRFIEGKKAEIRTNRHYTTGGRLWGWIEPVVRECGRDCAYWSNETSKNEEWAKQIVREHNDSLQLKNSMISTEQTWHGECIAIEV